MADDNREAKRARIAPNDMVKPRALPPVVFEHDPRRLGGGALCTIQSKEQARALLGVAPGRFVKLMNAAVWASESGEWPRIQRPAGTNGDVEEEKGNAERPCREWPIWTCDFHNVKSEGAKHYRVQSVQGFWRHYNALPFEERTHYEMIRDVEPFREHGRLTGVGPLKLYLDVEFERHDDKHRAKDMEAVVARIRERVLAGLYECFGHEAVDPVRCIEMTSDKPTKASRHLIYILGPGGSTAFASMGAVGDFVRHVFPALGKSIKSLDTREEPLLLWNRRADAKTHAGDLDHVVDGAVYKGNRSFRLCRSHKFGKRVQMDPTAATAAEGGWDPLTYDRFVDTLIGTHAVPIRRLLTLRLPSTRFPPALRTDIQESARPDAPYPELAQYYLGTAQGSTRTAPGASS